MSCNASGNASTPKIGSFLPCALVASNAPNAIPSLLEIITSMSFALELDNQASTLSFAIAASHIPVSINNCSVWIPFALSSSTTNFVRASASG